MGLMDERYWVGRCSLIAADELAKIVDAQVSTVNRRLLAQYEDEMVDYIEVGRGTRSKRRWCLTSSGVKVEYPVREKMQRQPGPDGHAHYALSAELDSHTHPPWWMSKEGVGRLYKRLEVVQACYQLFPDLFQGEGEAWHQGPGTLLPLTWQWLKALAESWWQAFLRSTLDDAQRSQLSEYLVGEILANDSGLASEWLVFALSHRNSCFVNLLNLAQDLDYWTQASIIPVGDTHRDESRPD